MVRLFVRCELADYYVYCVLIYRRAYRSWQRMILHSYRPDDSRLTTQQ